MLFSKTVDLAVRAPADVPAAPLTLKGIEYIELYVGNVHQAAHYYRTAFGFAPTARAGLETGVRDRASCLLTQGEARFLLTGAMGSTGPIAEALNRHGDLVKDVAFRVDDAAAAFHESVSRGARPVLAPHVIESDAGRTVTATVAGIGDVVHSFIEREDAARSLPAMQALPRSHGGAAPTTGIQRIDHVAFSLPAGGVSDAVTFYQNVFGLELTHVEDVTTAHSGMRSQVVQDRSGLVRFPMVEPAPGKRRSQVDEFLTFNDGAGAQHIALESDDIIATLRALRQAGVEFVLPPAAYYATLEPRVGSLGAGFETIRELGIMVDRDDSGLLLQTFTKPVQTRPTFFLEIIQRQGSRGFGSGNIRALFQAVEQEQALRGNL
jgi:4-hydroxyphenylpyruvate dioxygenase